MQTSSQGRELIEAFEGFYLNAYYDSVHVLTIGYGHTNLGNVPPAVKPGMTITGKRADAILSADLARFEARVDKIMRGVTLAQHEFDALVSFDFNTGDLISGSIDDKIKAGNRAAAMKTLLLYNKAGGRVLAGLTRRRKAEKLMFEGRITEALQLAHSK